MYEKYYNNDMRTGRAAAAAAAREFFDLRYFIIRVFFSRLPGDDVFIALYCILYLLLILHVHYYIAHNNIL